MPCDRHNQRTKKIPQDEWLRVKPELQRLWLKEKLHMGGLGGLVDVMKTDHRFAATPSQYEAQFRNWKWHKNHSTDDWQRVAAAVHALQIEGKEWEVFIRGELQCPASVKKKICPHVASSSSSLQLSDARTTRISNDITVRQSLSEIPGLLLNLPFQVIETALCKRGAEPQAYEALSFGSFASSIPSSLQISGSGSLSFLLGSSTRHTHASLDYDAVESLEIIDKSLVRASQRPDTDLLASVVPASVLQSTPATESSIMPSLLFRRVLFSLANNFAGLEEISIHNLMSFLRTETDEGLYQLLRSIPGPTSRAIALSILRGAIEVGDARLVDLILKEKAYKIEINQQLCVSNQTTLERAAFLGHIDVARVLLRHGADVNGTTGRFGVRGALNHAVMPVPSIRDKKPEFDPRLFKLLVEAGGHLQDNTLEMLLGTKAEELVVQIFLRDLPYKADQWSRTYILIQGFETFDEPLLTSITNTLIWLGFDFNQSLDELHSDSSHFGDFKRPIEIMAKRGFGSTFMLLLNEGVQPTRQTLSFAIQGGNKDIIGLLVNVLKVDIFAIEHGKSPYASAIASQNYWAMDLLENLGILRGGDRENQLPLAISAASTLGDLLLMDRLMQFGAKATPSDLRSALYVALTEGRDEDAESLIRSGADVFNRSAYKNSPLEIALQQRKTKLVHLLLEAGADPRIASLTLLENKWGSLELATKWGDHAIVNSLIRVGGKGGFLNRGGSKGPICIAALQRDLGVVKLLLDAGATVNCWCIASCTPLWAAIKGGSLDVALTILAAGADPNDQAALEAALGLPDRKLFELLINCHRTRYPRGRAGFGARVLKRAVATGDEGLAKRMLDLGADCNAFVPDDDDDDDDDNASKMKEDRSSITPFGYAIRKDKGTSSKFIHLFLVIGKCNANDIAYRPAWGSRILTGMLVAVETRNQSVISSLIRHGADIDLPARAPVKRTPLQRSAEMGATEIVLLLIRHGADVNAAPALRDGGTALQLAAGAGHGHTVCILLGYGADVDAPASHGTDRTALEEAAENGRLDVVKILLNAGAGTKPGTEHQVEHAVILAERRGQFPVADFLREHLELGKGPDRLYDVVMEIDGGQANANKASREVSLGPRSPSSVGAMLQPETPRSWFYGAEAMQEYPPTPDFSMYP